ncbi:MAG: tRNA (guanosine(46)-N7)-methyltransferase TrmB [Chromatiaceae bacterium]|nr:tRNA (guanosine(46)-N7)-methyltransferase TrmB [Chromatiaceae bacterium]MCP5315210.1 tRNA (guanosine(46)-N7)-methyltransferase TrmB [Chromatiaceae bacterium]
MHSDPPADDPNARHRHRSVRSFVLRAGRLTTGQQRALDQLLPQWGLEFAAQPLDLAEVFGNTQPVYLEIGFGNGESLAAMAQAHPERNYLGVEVHRPGVGHLLLRLEETGCRNVRVIAHDAVEVLQQMLPAGALQGVYLFFPDPWHKKRHHKRRILQPALLDTLARVIRPGGLFHAATDWQDYAEHMLRVLNDDPRFINTAAGGDYVPRPADRPPTKFERRGQRLGHGVWDLVFTRQP